MNDINTSNHETNESEQDTTEKDPLAEVVPTDAPPQNKSAMKAMAKQVARSPKDTWAANVDRVKVTEQPGGAYEATLQDRLIVSPLEGFGPLWQRTYRVRIPGDIVSPEDLMTLWKAEFPRFQPEENSFYPSRAGVKPGEMVYIDSKLVSVAGLDAVTEVSSGVMVIYADEVSFTVMTPEGFPVSGWNTFSAHEDDGYTVAQVQGLERSTDPIYEFGYRFMGGEKSQDRTWCYVLRGLARHYGVDTEVEMKKSCIDPRVKWSNAGNVFQNAMIHTFLFHAGAPVRWLRNAISPPTKKDAT